MKILILILFFLLSMTPEIICQENKILFSKKDSVEIAFCKNYYNYCTNELDSVVVLKLDNLTGFLTEEILICTITREKVNDFFRIRGYYNNQLRFQYYTNLMDVKQGKFTTYNSKDSIECDINFVNNKIDGVLRFRVSEKLLLSQNFVNGIKNGASKSFKNDKLEYFVNYKNGFKEGLEVEFYTETCCLRGFKVYKKGKVVKGTYDYFSECGLLEERYFYRKNKIRKLIFYDNTGNVTKVVKGRNLMN